MKELVIFLILTLIILPAMKLNEYFRYLKLHSEQVEQMELLIEELKAKQKVLNQRAKIIQESEVNQDKRLKNIYKNIYKMLDILFVNNI